MKSEDIAVASSGVALGASSASTAVKAWRGKRPTALDVVGVVASAVSFALSVWKRQEAKGRLGQGKREQTR